MSNQPVIVERTFSASRSEVWQAITDKNEMKQWYFDLQEFKAEIGFTFEFMGGEEGGEQFRHLCEVTEVEPEKKLTYSWRYDGSVGNSFVTWEIFDEGEGKTRLVLTHRGLETFPQDNPAFAASNFAAGWSDIINNSLKNYLETK